jgi:hypothetical protein
MCIAYFRRSISGSMKFKVGDKVKFLNEVGGGVVTAVLDSKMVKVESEGGFEMPVLVSELIQDFRAEDQSGMPYEVPLTTQAASREEPVEEEKGDDRITLINPWGQIKEERGIYLGYEPHERQWVLTGLLDIYLINHTTEDIVFNLFLQQDEMIRGIDYSFVPAHSKILLETIDRDQVENWSKGYLQVMFHQDSPKAVFLPVHSVIDIKPGRFFKEGSYRASGLLQGRSILVSIAPASTFEAAAFDLKQRKSDKTNQTGKAEPVKEKVLIDKHKTEYGVAVVDLHIGELIDNIAGLSSHDMFNIQIAYFKKALESALGSDYHKVTFIHGVGNGVLKNAMVEELKAYENLESKMASISKFGVGGLDVMIKNKE